MRRVGAVVAKANFRSVSASISAPGCRSCVAQVPTLRAGRAGRGGPGRQAGQSRPEEGTDRQSQSGNKSRPWTVHGHGQSMAMDSPWPWTDRPWTIHGHGQSMAMDTPKNNTKNNTNGRQHDLFWGTVKKTCSAKPRFPYFLELGTFTHFWLLG